MIKEGQILTIVDATYLNDYKLALSFNDGQTTVVDFGPFLSNSRNPLIRKYLNQELFKTFELTEGDLNWNDYDLCFPIADLYEGQIQ